MRNIYKKFKGVPVLEDMTLTVKTGESLVIIGRSGCGKSVTLKHMIGLLRPDSGEVIVDGMDITRLKEKELNKIRMNFGMLFQGAALFDSLNVLENVGFQLLEYSSMSTDKIRRRVADCLGRVGLAGIEEKKLWVVSSYLTKML